MAARSRAGAVAAKLRDAERAGGGYSGGGRNADDPEYAALAKEVAEINKRVRKQARTLEHVSTTMRSEHALMVIHAAEHDIEGLLHYLEQFVAGAVSFVIRMAEIIDGLAMLMLAYFAALFIMHYALPGVLDFVREIINSLGDVINGVIKVVRQLNVGHHHTPHNISAGNILGQRYEDLVHISSICRPTDSIRGIMQLTFFAFTRSSICVHARRFQYIPLLRWYGPLFYPGQPQFYDPHRDNCELRTVAECFAYSADKIILFVIYLVIAVTAVVSWRGWLKLTFHYISAVVGVVWRAVLTFYREGRIEHPRRMQHQVHEAYRTHIHRWPWEAPYKPERIPK